MQSKLIIPRYIANGGDARKRDGIFSRLLKKSLLVLRATSSTNVYWQNEKYLLQCKALFT